MSIKKSFSSSQKYSATNLLISGEIDLKRYNRWVANLFLADFNSTKKSRVMDFGAGIGTLAKIFLEITRIKPDCLEIDPKHLSLLKKSGFKSSSSLNNFNKNYDFIYSSNVLEHIQDDISTLKSLRSHLTSDGNLALYVPAFNFLWSSMDEKVGHCRRYTKKTLTSKLVESGYKIEKISYHDSVGFVLSILFKYLGNKNGEPSSMSLYFFDIFLLPLTKFLDFFFSSFFGKNVYVLASINKDAP